MMRFAFILTVFAAGVTIAGTPTLGRNPYSSIVDRNPFALVDPPPPTPVETVAPPSNVKLTGISTLGGGKKAMLMVTESGPGKTPTYMSLVEGEQNGAITCISIDFENGIVKITNAGRNETLNFKDNGLVAAPTPVAPAAPAMLPGGQPGGVVPPPGAAPGAAIPAPGAGGITSIGGQPGAQPGVQPANNGLRSIPSRQIRGRGGNNNVNSQGNGAAELEAAKALLELHRQEGNGGPPSPPAQ